MLSNRTILIRNYTITLVRNIHLLNGEVDPFPPKLKESGTVCWLKL